MYICKYIYIYIYILVICLYVQSLSLSIYIYIYIYMSRALPKSKLLAQTNKLQPIYTSHPQTTVK